MIRVQTVTAIGLQMSLTARQAEWLKGMMQNTDADTEADVELNSFRLELFDALKAAQMGVNPVPPPPAPPLGYPPPPPAPPPPSHHPDASGFGRLPGAS